MAKLTNTLLGLTAASAAFFLMNLEAEAGAAGVYILYDDISNAYYPAVSGDVDGDTGGDEGTGGDEVSGGHNNNGHGNNEDGVDVSNPGQGGGGPNGEEDPSGDVDDESHGGGSSGSSGSSGGGNH